MRFFRNRSYTNQLIKHYENYFGGTGTRLKMSNGPIEKLHKDFIVMEFPPSGRHNLFCYCTVGMSVDRTDDNLIELIVYSPEASMSIVELLTVCASYHRNVLPLNLNHTVNIGQGWLIDSNCDNGFISLPYLEGKKLEDFEYSGKTVHCYWLIPITQAERDYKIKNGCEALEQLFEEKQIEYANPKRDSLV